MIGTVNEDFLADQVRRAEWHKAKDEGKRVIKGSRYLLTAGSEHLDDDGKQRLVELTRLNERLSAAYILKEDFRWVSAPSPAGGYWVA